ncbi:MAG: tetratricopeptide repeat protein [Bacteroidia bacterium]|nr:tetratricopeptide repeat protein [Bacteroidia bacterium]
MKLLSGLTIFGITFLQILSGYSQSSLYSEGNESPSIIAKSISVKYGISVEVVAGLLDVYAQEGLSKELRKEKVETIIQHNEERINGKGQSIQWEKSLSNISIPAQKQIEKLFKWNLAITTKGDFSPSIFAGGNVEILYGMPPEAFFRLWNLLEKEYSQEQDRINKIRELTKLYLSLEKELENRLSFDEISKKAKEFLELGEFEKAIKILENDYSSMKKRLAFRAFEIAEARFLTLTFDGIDSTIYYFREATRNDPTNSKYFQKWGHFYGDLGRTDSAITLFRKAIEIDSLNDQKNGTEFTSKLSDLGRAYFKKGSHELGLFWIKKAYLIDSINLGEKNLKTAKELFNLASAILEMGEIETALTKFETAHGIYQSLLGDNYGSIGDYYSILGNYYYKKGEYDKSVTFFERSLNSDTLLWGKWNPSVGLDYQNLGTAYQKLGKFDLADSYFNTSLEITGKVYGLNHPSIARIKKNEATLLEEQGKYKEALKALEIALKIELDYFGNAHPSLATTYNSMGKIMMAIGENSKALEYYLISFEMDKKFFGEDNPKFALRNNNIASLYQTLGEYELADSFFFEALRIDTLNFGKFHPHISIVLNNLGFNKILQRDFPSAIDYYRQSLRVLSQSGSPGLNYGIILANLGAAYIENNQLDSALISLYRSRQIISQIGGPKCIQLTISEYNLGKLYFRQKNYNDAIKSFSFVWEIWKNVYPSNHPKLVLLVEKLVTTYEAKAEGFQIENMADSAIFYYKKGIYTSILSNKPIFLPKILHDLGTTFEQISNCDSSIYYYRWALKELESHAPSKNQNLDSNKVTLSLSIKYSLSNCYLTDPESRNLGKNLRKEIRNWAWSNRKDPLYSSIANKYLKLKN